MSSATPRDLAAATNAPLLARPEIYIRPRKGWSLALGHIWRYRELLYFFVWRDVKVKYKQSLIGAGWAVLQPFAMMVAFVLFFGVLADVPSQGLPYPIFYYSALLPWTYFSNAVNQSTNTFVTNSALIGKVFFPRVILPLSATLSGLLDLALAMLVLAGLLAYYGMAPTPAFALLPLFLLLAIATANGLGIWLSALNAKYRDVRYAVPFTLQLWLFASPVVYPSDLVPDRWRSIYDLNPMAIVIEGFRMSIAGTSGPRPAATVIAVCIVVVGTIAALFYFRRVEGTIADVI